MNGWINSDGTTRLSTIKCVVVLKWMFMQMRGFSIDLFMSKFKATANLTTEEAQRLKLLTGMIATFLHSMTLFVMQISIFSFIASSPTEL